MSASGARSASRVAWQVAPDEDGTRLDRLLVARVPGLSRGAARRLLREGAVRVEGQVRRTGAPVCAGERVTIAGLDPAAGAGLVAEPELPLVVVHEDAHLVVVDKPAGMHTHPQRPGERGTLANALVARYPETRHVGHSPLEPGLVHRLDRETSGILLVARDTETFDTLRRALAAGEIVKRYEAVCAGRLDAPSTLSAYLRAEGTRVAVRSEPFERARAVMLDVESSKPLGGDRSRVVVRLGAAGRHQVRALLAFAGHPIVGDRLYGGPLPPGLDRHLLHAAEIDLGRGLRFERFDPGLGA